MEVLATNGLAVGYAQGRNAWRTVLSGLDLSLPEATVTTIVGANGIGKSTLLRTLAGVQAPLEGDVVICGRNLKEMPVSERSRRLSLVYTDRVGGGGLTVRELVGLGRHPYTGFLGRLSREDKVAVDESMKAVGIGHKAECYVAMLSDGERQKMMIARALAQQTPLIVLDEPTAFLDVASRLEIMQLLGDLVRMEGKTVLLSTHDIAPAMSVSDRLWVVDAERHTITEGTVAEVVASGAMESVFPSRPVFYDSAACDFKIRE